jgi:hypothetical protein
VLEAATIVLDAVSAVPVLDLLIQIQGRAQRAPIGGIRDRETRMSSYPSHCQPHRQQSAPSIETILPVSTFKLSLLLHITIKV